MASTTSLLSQRTWFQLRTTAFAQQLRFDTHWTLDEARERVYAQIVPRLKRASALLNARERRALQALQAADGCLSRWRFTRHFGCIRPCTQRRPTNWRVDLTPAEHLWLIGFIELSRDARYVYLTQEASALLPPLPLPERRIAKTAPGSPRVTLCIDLAAFLGTLLREDAAPRYGRWLSPRTLHAVNRQLRWRSSLSGIRSERSAGRVSFLHYLAEAAGLIAEQGGFLKPTVAAWEWLALPFDQAWERLWSALQADRDARRLWTIYRLPEVSDEIWNGLLRWLTLLPAGTYSAASLIAAVQPYCPGVDADQLTLSLEMLLETVLSWIGWAVWADDTITVLPRAVGVPQSAAFVPETLTLDLPDHPPLLPYARLLGWCEPVNRRVRLDEAMFRAAVECGASALTLAQTLAELVGKLPASILDTFRQWERNAQAFRLETLTVLTASDPAALDALCADRGLRPLIDKPLSRHHLAVRPEHAQTLCRRLHRRGQPVTDQQPTPPPAPPTTDLYAYCYLAVRALQTLGASVTLPADIPGAVRRWLADQLPPEQISALDSMAARIEDTFAQTLSGHADPPPITPANPDSIRAALHAAYETGASVKIDYLSPARGAVTTRCIEPIRRYERGGAEYVEAWCDLDNEPRTFRVDRVLRVHS